MVLFDAPVWLIFRESPLVKVIVAPLVASGETTETSPDCCAERRLDHQQVSNLDSDSGVGRIRSCRGLGNRGVSVNLVPVMSENPAENWFKGKPKVHIRYGDGVGRTTCGRNRRRTARLHSLAKTGDDAKHEVRNWLGWSYCPHGTLRGKCSWSGSRGPSDRRQNGSTTSRPGRQLNASRRQPRPRHADVLAMRSMAAREFCCISVRLETSAVVFTAS